MAKTILIISILSMGLLTSCTKSINYTTTPISIDCGKPKPPIYNTLNPNYPITHPNNKAMLLDNLMIMGDYIQQLEQTIDCYEGYTE